MTQAADSRAETPEADHPATGPAQGLEASSEPPRRDLHGILRSVVWMTSSGFVSALLTVLRGLLFARILGPASYGTWGFLSTIQNMSVYADLGVGQVVARDLPRALANGRTRSAASLIALARIWTASACLMLGVILSVLWPLMRWPAAPGWAILVPLMLSAMGLYVTAGIVETGSMAFRRIATFAAVTGTMALLGGVAASLLFGVSGLVASQTVVYGGAGLVAIALRPAKPRLSELRVAWRRAVGEGWRLLLPGLGLQVFVSVDVLVVASAFASESIGLYSVALLGSTMVAGVLASGVASVAGPRLLGETADPGGERPSAMVWGPPAALATVLAPACCVAALLTPWVLGVLLPQYAKAAAPAVILFAAAYYLHSQFGFSSTFVAIGRPVATLPLYAVLTPLNVAIDLFLLRQGLGLPAVAIGSLVANAAFMVSHSALVAFRVSRGRRQYAQIVATLAAGGLPIAAAATVLGYTALAWASAALGLVGWFGLVFVTWRWLGSRFSLRARPRVS